MKLKVLVSATKELGKKWASDDEFAVMTDEQIIDLVQEDLIEFLYKAKWKVSVTKK